MHTQHRTFGRRCGAIGAAMALSACGGGSTDMKTVDASAATHDAAADGGDHGSDRDGGGSKSRIEIRTLSNRADLISDGNALVEVQVPRNVQLSRVKVLLNGVDITASSTADTAARTLRGVVNGLKVGRNEPAVHTKPGKGGGHGVGHDDKDD